ncbi:hypothetical protein HDE68_003534 [Pedobacter cryoconitis]|uniref:DUF4349 domain-containing protein n=1 Tax=Pedobacter cryoconitis TaxID=188932 RepID=A0A7W8ZP53_9SPHI|nr:DUF4349 domain-containing protein [Pedobacter cryoconitis]MBB5637619.1 hypothetical protein [Pedobacter cryoconitis]
MMKKYLIYGILSLTVLSCNSEKKSGAYETADSQKQSSTSSSDTPMAEKIVKTADMRFRVKDVQSTKEKLGSILRAEGGTIAEFNTHSQIRQNEKVKYSADSLLELISYRVEGLVVAKIPAEKLDDFTNQIAKMAVFIDDQSLKQDDQSINYLSNQLKNRNKLEAVTQLNNSVSGKKTGVAERSLALKDEYVDNKANNLLTDRNVRYSTITLNFYQDNTVKKMIVVNDELADYRPDFFKRFWLSFENGWSLFKEFILILANLWAILLVIAAGYFIFRHYRRKKLMA